MSPEPALPETDKRRCPSCHSEQIGPVGRVIAERMIKAEHQCEACGVAFLVVQMPSGVRR
jgi:hypothetical protein